MDISPFIPLAVVALGVFLLVKFVISPLVKLIVGIVLLVAILLILRNLFEVSFNQYLGPWAVYANVDLWLSQLQWLFDLIAKYWNQVVPAN